MADAIFRNATDGKPRLRYTANGAGAFLSLNRWLSERVWRGLMKSAFLKTAR
jgi:hypothetical protein